MTEDVGLQESGAPDRGCRAPLRGEEQSSRQVYTLLADVGSKILSYLIRLLLPTAPPSSPMHPTK